jgi:hypothetical protein
MTGLRSFWAAAGIVAGLSGIAALVPAWAHHSFGLYDMTRSADVDGTVVQMEWSNPHCWLFIRTSRLGRQRLRRHAQGGGRTRFSHSNLPARYEIGAG